MHIVLISSVYKWFNILFLLNKSYISSLFISKRNQNKTSVFEYLFIQKICTQKIIYTKYIQYNKNNIIRIKRKEMK